VTPMSWVTFLEADADCSPLSNRSSVAVIERSMSLLLAGYDLWTNRSAAPMIWPAAGCSRRQALPG
jgi:hypothetical protein